MLSILVTYYNQEKFVSRSLESILHQKLSVDFEILVGDDGSQDNTRKIVEEYQEQYPGIIKLFVQPRDYNVLYNPVERASKNRLDLFKNAQGEYVCFLDGDDEYCDFDWLQESIDMLEKNPSFIGVAHNYCEKYKDGKIYYPEGIKNFDFISPKIYAKNLYTHVGTILFRNIFNEKDYELLISLKSFDDNDIIFYFLNYGNLLCVDKVVYSYFQNEGSIWNSTNEIEKAIINAIDYEIIKKIFKQQHNVLLFKYFRPYYLVFKNRKDLNNEKYKKYINQCVTDGKVEKILCWNKLSINKKNYLYIFFVGMKIYFFFLRFFSKIVKIFKL